MKLNIEIPDACLKGRTEYDIKMLIANKLYESGIIGTSVGAEIVGIDREDFILNMGKYGVGIINLSEEEFKKEIINAKKF